MSPTLSSFDMKSCALVTMSTGITAQSVKELKDGLMEAPRSSIYYHFWGRLLRPHFGSRDFSNDFAAWIHDHVGDKLLAERINSINPFDFDDYGSLIEAILETLDDRLASGDFLTWAKADYNFFFVSSKMIVIETGISINKAESLPYAVKNASNGSIFYHFVDAKRRTASQMDDFSVWLANAGDTYGAVVKKFLKIDPYFLSLKELKSSIMDCFHDYWPEVEGE